MKKKIICPECNHAHTVTVSGLPTVTTGVRAKRVTGNQFEYSLTAPAPMSESGSFTTVTDDILLSGAVGLGVGAVFGFATSLIAPDYAPQIIGTSASLGGTIAWGWLCAEHNQRLKRIAPWFAEQQKQWIEGKAQVEDRGVKLTIDHRHRDGSTEIGRTINYFGVLPVDVAQFNEWAIAALQGKSIAIDHWTGSGKPFSRGKYDELLNLMRKAGTVIKIPGKGNQIGGGGRRALGRHLKQEGIDPPPPPEERAI